MSYTEIDAWLDELAQGDWPFEQWALDSFPLRSYFGYFPDWSNHIFSDVRVLQQRLFASFNGAANGLDPHQLTDRLQSHLAKAVEIVHAAIEESRNDAYVAWSRHEVWLPAMDETNSGDLQPAQVLIESIDYVASADEEPQAVLGALGLWLIGEWYQYRQDSNGEMAGWALTQAAIALAEAEMYRGIDLERSRQRNDVSRKNRIGAEVRHAANRESKQKGREIWESKEWRYQSDAAREIARQVHIVEAVANRWIREFKRAGNQK